MSPADSVGATVASVDKVANDRPDILINKSRLQDQTLPALEQGR